MPGLDWQQQQQMQAPPGQGVPVAPMGIGGPGAVSMGVPPGMHAQGNLGSGAASKYKSQTELEAARREEERDNAEKAQARYMAEQHAIMMQKSNTAAANADAAKRERMANVRSTNMEQNGEQSRSPGGRSGMGGGADSPSRRDPNDPAGEGNMGAWPFGVMSPTQPSNMTPRGGGLSPGTEKARILRDKAAAAARDPEDWVKENRRRAAGSFVIGGVGGDNAHRPSTPLTTTQLEDPRDLYERRVGGAGSVGQPNGQAEEIARQNRRKQANSSIFGGEEAPEPGPSYGAVPVSGSGGGEEYQFGLEYDGPPIPGMPPANRMPASNRMAPESSGDGGRVPTADRLDRGGGSGITYGNPASPTHTRPSVAVDPTRTRRVAIPRSRVNGVGYGMTLNDCEVTGFRGEFGPAERAGVSVGWNIVGVSGSSVDSMETLASALVRPPQTLSFSLPLPSTPVD